MPGEAKTPKTVNVSQLAGCRFVRGQHFGTAPAAAL